MPMSPSKTPLKGAGAIIDRAEELVIVALLGFMTVLTFLNVVLRYVFNSSLIWGLELVLVFFAWLVLFGIPYGFKKTSHLGVDVAVNLLSGSARKKLALVSCMICLIYSFMLMKGAWDYWAPFASLPTLRSDLNLSDGLFVATRDRAFYVTDQIPMPGILRFLEDLINQGEEYEKLPRVVPYAMLPFAVALMIYRIIQATYQIATGHRATLIASHEAEDAVAEAARTLEGR